MKYITYFLLLCLCSCLSKEDRMLVQDIGETQGTYYHIQYLSNGGKDYKIQIDSILSEIDSSLSIYKSYSLISRLNNGENIKVDNLFQDVYQASKIVYYESEGSFDCSIFPLVQELGFYKKKLEDNTIIDSIRISKILDNIGFFKISLIDDSLVLPKGMYLDFNSLAQGYSIDLIAKFLENKGDSNYLIEIGGEILAKGLNADGRVWRVGVDKPSHIVDNNNRFQFILDLENKALATSGNYRRFYKIDSVRYSHSINPISGYPVQNRLLSVSVIHDDCMFADAYATAFMVMGVNRTKTFLKDREDIEVYLIFYNKDDRVLTYVSPKMQERIIH